MSSSFPRHLSVELKHVDLDRGGRRVLSNVTWRIRPGQRWALLGPNGAGKTQLLKLIAGDVWPTPTARGKRSYLLRCTRHEEPYGIKERIAYVGAERQDKYDRYDWNPTVAELVATGLKHTDILLDRITAPERRQIKQLLRRFGLTAFAGRKVLTLSYGERRLALIARALATRPRLLLLDEVFNGLDGGHRQALMRYLDDSRRSRMPWVLSVHRRVDLPQSVTHALVLEGGRIAYAGPRLRARLEDLIEDKSIRASARKGTRKGGLSRISRLLITIRNADVFVDHHRVLSGISWEIRKGEHWAVIGPNGAGKSTLLRLLYGDLSPALGGSIERNGFSAGTPIEEFKKRVGLLSPDLQSAYARDDITVEEIVVSGKHASIGLNEPASPGERHAARRWLRFFGLTQFASCRPRQISYGQMRRVLLARAMINRPRLLLLDEPCTGLDAAARLEMRRYLERLAHSDVQLVMATHHMSDLVPAIGRVLKLRDGRTMEA